MDCHTIVLRANIENRGREAAQVQGYTAVVQIHDFITAIITKDHGNCGCFQQVGWEAVGIVPEPSAMPSSDPSVAMRFLF